MKNFHISIARNNGKNKTLKIVKEFEQMLHELEETNDKLLNKKLMYIISHLENANLK